MHHYARDLCPAGEETYCISKTLNFPQLPWPLTTAYSKLQHLTAPYNIIGTRSDV
jgi:hypothetical protein